MSISGDTVIDTPDGRAPVEDLAGTRPFPYSTYPAHPSARIIRADRVFVSGKNRPLVRIVISDGEFDCTRDHRVLLADGTYKEAGSLISGETLRALKAEVTALSHTASQLITKTVTGGPKRFNRSKRFIRSLKPRKPYSVDNEGTVEAPPATPEEPRRPERFSMYDRIVRDERLLQNLVDAQQAFIDAAQEVREIGDPTNTQVVLRVQELEVVADKVYDVAMPPPHNFAAGEARIFTAPATDSEDLS